VVAKDSDLTSCVGRGATATWGLVPGVRLLAHTGSAGLVTGGAEIGWRILVELSHFGCNAFISLRGCSNRLCSGDRWRITGVLGRSIREFSTKETRSKHTLLLFVSATVI
jgi:hypothetical protein